MKKGAVRRIVAGMLSGIMVFTMNGISAMAEETADVVVVEDGESVSGTEENSESEDVECMEDAAEVSVVATDAGEDTEGTESVESTEDVGSTEDTESVESTEDAESTESMEEVTVLYSGVSGDLDWSITSDGVLTISGEGDYELDTSSSVYPGWKKYYRYITSAIVNVTDITTTAYMFYGCDNIEAIDLTGLDTSKVTSMTYMFSDCDSLSTVDISSLDTGNVTDMSYMFFRSPITSIDISSLNTSNVTDMSDMFSRCYYLVDVDFGNIDTSNVTSIAFFN